MWAGVMGLGGALVGGFVTFVVGQRAVSAQKMRDDDAERAHVRATLQAIRDEVTVLSEVHMTAAGTAIKEASAAAPIELFYPVSAHYFTAFEANAGSIGRVENDVLRCQIVRTYVHFKALFDTVRLNNHFVERLEHAEAAHRAASEQHVPIARNEAELHWRQAAAYAPLLQEANRRAMESAAALVLMIDQWLAEPIRGVGAAPLRQTPHMRWRGLGPRLI